MQRQAHFGRRPEREARPRSEQIAVAAAAPASVPLVDTQLATLLESDSDAAIDLEIAEWNRQRKARTRRFREPWRSFSIAAALGFGASEWLLPDSVARIADLVSFGLFAVSLIVGFRRRCAKSAIAR